MPSISASRRGVPPQWRVAGGLAVSLVLAVALVATTATASGRPAGGAQASCGKRMTFLFWPKGHPAVPSVGFPKLRAPHLEIYKGSNPRYPMSDFVAWAVAGKTPPNEPAPYVSPYCVSAGSSRSPAELPFAAPLKATARVVCAFPKSAAIAIDELSRRRFRVNVVLPPRRLAAQALIAPRGSTFAYSRQHCTRKPPPRG